MKLIYITDDADVARFVVGAGVDSVMVDLEHAGKFERQGHLNTLISGHDISSIKSVASAISGSKAEVMVRVNPVSSSSTEEVDLAISLGANRLMLPMFRSLDDVKTFLRITNGRVPVTLLVETATAYARLPRILALPAEFDIHVGLNDLHLEMKLDFMFELFMYEGVVDHVAYLCRKYNRKFGVGGVARVYSKSPLSASDVLSEHARVGSSAVILSRDWKQSLIDGDFGYQIDLLRALFCSAKSFESDRFSAIISSIADSRSQNNC